MRKSRVSLELAISLRSSVSAGLMKSEFNGKTGANGSTTQPRHAISTVGKQWKVRQSNLQHTIQLNTTPLHYDPIGCLWLGVSSSPHAELLLGCVDALASCIYTWPKDSYYLLYLTTSPPLPFPTSDPTQPCA